MSRMDGYDKVFGIGLNKTGTTSLKKAFVRLGFNHLERRPRLFKLWRNRRFEPIFEHAEEYESFEDWPWPLMVAELLEYYGDRARFVMTRRTSANAWVESLKRHAERTNPVQNPRKHIFGYDYPHGREAEHMAIYDRHQAHVAALFKGCEHQLCTLCWEDGDGWPELCEFLDRPVPSGAFPRANRSVDAQPDPEFVAENRRRIEAQLADIS